MARKKMDPTWKAKWLKALRSGKYSQTNGHLRDGNGHCCLGVAHDLLVNGKAATWDDPTWSGKEAHRGDLLGKQQLAILGFTDDTQKTLATLNDDDGATFNEIADWIEANI